MMLLRCESNTGMWQKTGKLRRKLELKKWVPPLCETLNGGLGYNTESPFFMALYIAIYIVLLLVLGNAPGTMVHIYT